MNNSINSLSPNIRDFLLNRNLILSDTVVDNNLSSIASGLGVQRNLNSIDNNVKPSTNLEISSIDSRNNSIKQNRYISIEDMVNATIIDNSKSYKQINGGYIKENNELNIGGSVKGLDVIDSIVSQDGFGLGNNGFTPQGNIRTSLTGRFLGATGIIKETPLGMIAGQQLLLAFAQRVTFNTQRELFGQLNLQPFSLLKGNDLMVPDNSITISSTKSDRATDIALDITGFNLPINIIDDKASIFTQDVEKSLSEASLTRNNTLINYTGRGQLNNLFTALKYNKYKPAYISKGSNRTDLKIDNPKEYEVVKDKIVLTNTVESLIGGTPFISTDNFLDSDQIWSPTSKFTKRDDLLSKTKKLFDDGKLSYEINFDRKGEIDNEKSQLTTSSGGRLSRSSGVLSENYLKNGVTDNMFCRTWTSIRKYDNINALQKNEALINYNNRYRNDIEGSVLDDNGFVKVSPYKSPKNENTSSYDAKKFMFSIENLAWNDNLNSLPEFERGLGDPLTKTRGRVMWFPPYDIKFNESTSVDIDTTKFIGRGEPLYTYNNTERSGNLSFKIIIDYPDYMNDIRYNNDIQINEIISSIVAGCSDYDEFFSVEELNKIKEIENIEEYIDNVIVAPKPDLPEEFKIYFPNDVADINSYPNYEVSGNTLTETEPDEGFNSQTTESYANNSNFNLNGAWNEPGFISNLKTQLDGTTGIKIKLIGNASKAGTSDINKKLTDARIESIKGWFISNGIDNCDFITESNGDDLAIDPNVNPKTSTVDSEAIKRERVVIVQFIYDGTTDELIKDVTDIKKAIINNKQIVDKIKRRFHREDEYFKKLEKSEIDSDKIIYDNIKTKIKYFHPAFHSTTPEGFNSRLTFLQQCTRQGPTTSKKTNNLAFGSPPVCILRIGDFYHTKIIINSLDIDYEPLLWDLNPEGIGVQPRLANINISFKFIGGSALNGPINKLQNAVSFNYFANSGVYDPRADRLIRSESGDNLEYSSGVKNLAEIIRKNERVEDELTEKYGKLLSDFGIKKDEINIALKANNKQINPILDDKTILKDLTISSGERISNTNEFSLNFKYSKKDTTEYTLGKEYLGFVTLTKLSDATLKTTLGQIKVIPNGLNSFIFSDIDNTKTVVLTNDADVVDIEINSFKISEEIINGPQFVIDSGFIITLEWKGLNLKSSTFI